jgi:hypothetical protein
VFIAKLKKYLRIFAGSVKNKISRKIGILLEIISFGSGQGSFRIEGMKIRRYINLQML